MTRLRDLVVVGGGPAGLAVAIAAALRDLDVLVLERRSLPADKPCGEGILPAGVAALDALGVLPYVDPDARSRITAIRWIEDGVALEAPLPAPGGLGLRRTALSGALLARARALGVEVRTELDVVGHERTPERVRIATNDGGVEARLLVAADGLHSAIAAREQLAVTLGRPARFGLRRHFRCAPWTDAVEVHLGDGVEAYVTPTGPKRVGVALLCEEDARAPFPALLERFPAIADRLRGCAHDSRIAGAGPFPQGVRVRTLDRLVLVGDAGGYEDAITGDGLSLAFQSALALGPVLPAALASGARATSFASWERDTAQRYRRYVLITRAVLALVRRRAARRGALRLLGGQRRLIGGLVGLAMR